VTPGVINSQVSSLPVCVGEIAIQIYPKGVIKTLMTLDDSSNLNTFFIRENPSLSPTLVMTDDTCDDTQRNSQVSSRLMTLLMTLVLARRSERNP
jgi:hypothetical protein